MLDNNKILNLIDRKTPLFKQDIDNYKDRIKNIVTKSRFLVIGGAGTIGNAVVKEIFSRSPLVLDVIDLSENNLVEVVRDLRSTIGYINGEFNTYALDVGSIEFKNLFLSKEYDYILNLSALKHVRSEKDPYTIMRMIQVNIINNLKLLDLIKMKNVKNYFCVSTDKASNPINLMGASKRIMEIFLMTKSIEQKITMARFANVAFSDGSLLHGLKIRLEKKQPFSIPKDIKRYFITAKEAGQLCLLSCLFGNNRDILFPKIKGRLKAISFMNIASKFLNMYGYECLICKEEKQARDYFKKYELKGKWPCFIFDSNTTGEKYIEELYTTDEKIDFNAFQTLGIVKNKQANLEKQIELFCQNIGHLRKLGIWQKDDLLKEFHNILPNFNHHETFKYLDQKM